MAQQPTIPEAKVIFLADAWARGYTLAELEKAYGYNDGTIKKYIIKYLGEEAFEEIKERKRKEEHQRRCSCTPQERQEAGRDTAH